MSLLGVISRNCHLYNVCYKTLTQCLALLSDIVLCQYPLESIFIELKTYIMVATGFQLFPGSTTLYELFMISKSSLKIIIFTAEITNFDSS